MTIENSTTTALPATYAHETINEEVFYELSENWSFITFGDLLYSHVEYMNSPHGLIVLAHHDDIAGQVDGIHPAILSHSIERPTNIIEPLTSYDGTVFHREPVAYNAHWMTRRSQGSLVLAGFGRMVDGGDPAALCFKAREGQGFTLRFYDAPNGPVVAIIDEGNSDLVHVIRPESAGIFSSHIREATSSKEAA